MVQPMVCVACGAEVSYGRLSCPSCGELLASVAGARRPTSIAAVTVAEPITAPERAVPTVLHDDRPSPEGAVAASDWPDLGLFGVLDSPDGDDADGDADPVAPAPVADSSPPTSAAPPASAAPVMTAAAAASMPGAYVPPVLQPAGPPAPARTWAGHPPGGAVAGADAAMSAASDASDTSDGANDADRAVEAVGWLAVAGAALIVIGFLLPWSSISVIGAAGVGYFDRWGFAGDGHPLVLLAVLSVLALALLRDRVPVWLGVGLPGLALGGVLLGLAWPYLVGPLGGQIGVLVVAVGAVGLIVAGAAAIVLDRHARGDRLV